MNDATVTMARAALDALGIGQSPLREVVDYLSAPPADDVREALALAIDPNALEIDAYPWPLNAADRVLAAFEVRPRGKVTGNL